MVANGEHTGVRASDPLIGVQLGGYLIEGLLGRGAMGDRVVSLTEGTEGVAAQDGVVATQVDSHAMPATIGVTDSEDVRIVGRLGEAADRRLALARPPPQDPLGAERQQMEAFAASRLRWFQGRTHQLEQLTGFIYSTGENALRSDALVVENALRSDALVVENARIVCT